MIGSFHPPSSIWHPLGFLSYWLADNMFAGLGEWRWNGKNYQQSFFKNWPWQPPQHLLWTWQQKSLVFKWRYDIKLNVVQCTSLTFIWMLKIKIKKLMIWGVFFSKLNDLRRLFSKLNKNIDNGLLNWSLKKSNRCLKIFLKKV